MVQRVIHAIDQWTAIAAILGFVRQWSPGDSPARRYLTEAIFPFYIVHQTAIVVLAHRLTRWIGARRRRPAAHRRDLRHLLRELRDRPARRVAAPLVRPRELERQ